MVFVAKDSADSVNGMSSYSNNGVADVVEESSKEILKSIFINYGYSEATNIMFAMVDLVAYRRRSNP